MLQKLSVLLFFKAEIKKLKKHFSNHACCAFKNCSVPLRAFLKTNVFSKAPCLSKASARGQVSEPRVALLPVCLRLEGHFQEQLTAAPTPGKVTEAGTESEVSQCVSQRRPRHRGPESEPDVHVECHYLRFPPLHCPLDGG